MLYTIYTDANLFLSTAAFTDASFRHMEVSSMKTQSGDNKTAREFSCIRLTPARDRGKESAYYVIPRPITAETWYRSSITFFNIDWSKVAPYRGKKPD
jgi:hypothetical protein